MRSTARLSAQGNSREVGMSKIPQLEELASEMIGDGGSPDVFFVSLKGNIVLITIEFEEAYQKWRESRWGRLGCHQESTLESRQYGVICFVEPEEDSQKLVVHDDSEEYKRQCLGK